MLFIPLKITWHNHLQSVFRAITGFDIVTIFPQWLTSWGSPEELVVNEKKQDITAMWDPKNSSNKLQTTTMSLGFTWVYDTYNIL
jgi:hypothetical protein